MGANSHIAWTNHTFNPWLGCVEVSPACDNCYARTLVTGRMGKQVWGKDAPRNVTSVEYWHQPIVWDRHAAAAGERHRVFCGSLCDVMEDRPELAIPRRDLFSFIFETPRLDWLLLTKRPQNFRRFLPAPWLAKPRPNVWGMTTVESPAYLWRVDALRDTPFAVRGLSVEPLLEPIELDLRGIHWVIVGGESGGKARPFYLEWARDIQKQCKAAGVAFFMKQAGSKPFESPSTPVKLKLKGKGDDPAEWPEQLRVQELPRCAGA